MASLTLDDKLDMSLDDARLAESGTKSRPNRSEDKLSKMANPNLITNGRLYVGNLSFDTSWQDLKDHMRQCGEVIHADILMYPGTNRSKGCGVVQFATAHEAVRAIDQLNNSLLHDRPIFIREDRVANTGARRSRSSDSHSTSVYIGNLPYSYSWQDLKDLCKTCGEVSHADVILDSSQRSRGFGIVQFASRIDAEHAVQQLNGADINGRPIFVRFDSFA